MTDIPKRYYTLKEAAEEIGATTCCLRDRGKIFGLIPFNRGFGEKVKLTRDDVDTLKLIHNLITVNGLKTWRIKELLKNAGTSRK